MEPIICPYCGEEAEFISNEAIYGRAIGRWPWVYWCRADDAYVGTHQNSRRPLGTLANAELRELRVRCHEHIDPLWRGGRYRRTTVYRALAHVFGREIHIAEADIETCRKILQLKLMRKETI